MNFKLNFITFKDEKVASQCRCDSRGFEDVDRVRELYGKDIPIDRITYECSYFSRNFIIELMEKEARNLKVFQDTSNIWVLITPNSFNKFIYRKYTNGIERISIWKKLFLKLEITMIGYVEIKNCLDEKKIVETWVKHGCPILWNPMNDNGDFYKDYDFTDEQNKYTEKFLNGDI